MNRELLTCYGLKWNPFAPDLPVDSLMATAAVDSFCLRIERHLWCDSTGAATDRGWSDDADRPSPPMEL